MPFQSNIPARLTLSLCAAAALFEGFDTQSMGVAAPRIAQELGLASNQLGFIFSSGTLGLFVGAALGGRIADRVGRARTLSICLLLFGVFSLLTSAAVGPNELLAARIMTGLGLGGAMPTSIALASEAIAPQRRVATTATLMAMMPMGGALTGLIALTDKWGWSWRDIFYIGGCGPIVVGFAVLLFLRKPLTAGGTRSQTAASETMRMGALLFSGGRARATLLLWVGYFFTQLVLLLMLNWLPSLMLGLGFSRAQASWGSVAFNICGALGTAVLSRLHASSFQRGTVIAIYAGMLIALIALPRVGPHFPFAATACAFAGVFIIGAQMILFALAPLFYPRADRAAGTGAAVAIGRLGSVVGPTLAGILLAGGATSGSVFIAMVPFIVIAGSAVFALAWCPRSEL